jgi:hypothetical protein
LSELTSDEAAANAVGDRAAYAATLEQFASEPQFIPSTVAMADSPSLGRRLKRLLSAQGSSAPLGRPWRTLLISVMLVVVALAAVPWAGAVGTTGPAEQRPTTLEFHLVDEQHNSSKAQQNAKVPPGDKVYQLRDGSAILLKREAIATSDEVAEATVMTTPEGPGVDIRLDARGAASMLSTTRENVGHELAVVYNGRVISHALIRGMFGGRFQVTGLTEAEASALAMQFGHATRQ